MTAADLGEVPFVAIPGFLTVEPEVEEDEAGVYHVVTALAECGATGRFVTLDCELACISHAFGQPANRWFHEFSFQITCHDPDQGPFSTQDRNIAAGYLPEDVRPHVIALVEAGLRALAARVRPRVIYRVAKTVNGPPKAYEKHHRLTACLQALGFDLCERGTDPLGRPFWIMKKQ